jgi:hypothetical protein
MAPIENINAGETTFQARALAPGTWQQSKCSGIRLQEAAAVGNSINDCARYVCAKVRCVVHHLNTRRVSLNVQRATHKDYVY